MHDFAGNRNIKYSMNFHGRKSRPINDDIINTPDFKDRIAQATLCLENATKP